MKIYYYRPLKTNYLTQDFGDAKACVDEQDKIWGKVNGKCLPGMRDLYVEVLKMLGHNGRDWSCYYSEPNYHPMSFDGWMKTEVDDKGGVGVDVISNEPILKCNEPNCNEVHYIKWRSWHNLKINGYDKMPVKIGQVVAFGDSTGWSGGNHLHEALKWCNKDGGAIHTDNGFKGVIKFYNHPDIIVDNTFVLEVLNLKEQLSFLQKVAALYSQLIWTLKKP